MCIDQAWGQILWNTNTLEVLNTNTYTKDVFKILLKVFKYFLKYFCTLILTTYTQVKQPSKSVIMLFQKIISRVYNKSLLI